MILSIAVSTTALLFGGMTGARQMLMPAINRATDCGERQRFRWLWGLSMVTILGHIAAAGLVLVLVRQV